MPRSFKNIATMVAGHKPPDDYSWRDDKNRKGVFYYNRKDKRHFAPRLSGVGYTVNFASP